MAELILPDSRFEMPELFYPGRKPVGKVKIDGSHPLALGLVFATIDFKENLVVPETLDSNDSLIKANILIHDDVTDKLTLDVSNFETKTKSEVSYCLGYEKTDGTNRASGAFGYTAPSSADRSGVSLPYSDGIVYFDHGGVANGVNRLVTSGVSYGNDDWVFISSVAQSKMEMYQNGILEASNSGGVTRSVAGAQPFSLGTHAAQSSDLAKYRYFYIYSIPITNASVKRLSKDPYQFLIPV